MSGPLLGRDLGGAGDGRGGVEADGGDSLGYSHHMQLPARDTRQDQAGLDICDVRSYTATNNQIHRVSICLAVQCSAAVSKYRIKY